MQSLSSICVGLLATFLTACRPPSISDSKENYVTWNSYLGDPGRTHYALLEQINLSNVNQLKMVWKYQSGLQPTGGSDYIQCNPLVVGRMLFAVAPGLKVFALDATTGVEQWMFDPFVGTDQSDLLRGLAYWSNGDESRILFTADRYLYALDANTGESIISFGEAGKVDMSTGLGCDVSDLIFRYLAPGTVYEDLIILGSITGVDFSAAPGHIRAFDVRTGEQRWIFHTIPQPGEYGYDTWEDSTAYQTIGGANNWSGMTLDESRGIVFVPLGSAAFDFYGGNRKGDNLFANCLLALDAATGKRLWHFQAVHHDIWDRDLPAPPTLVTVERNGALVDAVAQVTKSGHVYVFERETGKPLFPIEEKPYPASDLVGEQTEATQPLPTLPPAFSRQQFTEADLNPYTRNRDSLLAVFRQMRAGGQFIPPSLEGTVIFPGLDGGASWSGAGYNPTTNVLFVNANEMPFVLKMLEKEEAAAGDWLAMGQSVYQSNCMSCHGAERQGSNFHGNAPALTALADRMDAAAVRAVLRRGRGEMPSFAHLSDEHVAAVIDFLLGTTAGASAEKLSLDLSTEKPQRYGFAGYRRFTDADGYPAVKPPWGTLNAIDLNSGEILWKVPLGEFLELTRRGIPKTGTENYGGVVVTAGGLIFIGATQDKQFRAFNQFTGEEVWKHDLPAAGMATPCTYEVDGRQYVVIAAGGGKITEQRGDSYMAFALSTGEDE